jgi:arsenite methyltransferase
MTESQDSAASSQGHRGADVGWFDTKFQMAEPEYLAVARAAGFQPGWHVLDAGCGSGSFLPALADLVGSTGQLTALDLAPENVATVCQRVEQWGFPVPLETRTGSVTALPFDDHTFDALWCANVTLYLSDAELEKALAEFRRVVKPGGLVAIKDVDLAVTRVNPAPTGFFWHFLEATQDISVQIHGALRSQTLKRWLERAGFAAVWQQTTLIERWAPLRPVDHLYISNILAWSAKYALQTDLAREEIAIWEKLSSRDSVDSLVNHPNFYFGEGIVLATGYAQS